MKLLFDRNLSPRLPRLLEDLYPDSADIRDLGMRDATDTQIWEYAKANGFAIVSKDSDFQERSVLFGSPPKVVWIRAKNCTTTQLQDVLRTAFPIIKKFVQADAETCLILEHR